MIVLFIVAAKAEYTRTPGLFMYLHFRADALCSDISMHLFLVSGQTCIIVYSCASRAWYTLIAGHSIDLSNRPLLS